TKLRLQIRTRRRNLQHRCCTRLLRSLDLPIRILQQQPST
ncbi:hypothetical protein, partial [Nostoc sp. PCC 7120 = FACHB-418]